MARDTTGEYALALSPAEFAAKWQGSTRTERAAAQEHFIDLCRMLGTKTPNEADPTGDWYAFEKFAEKVNGEDGYADVWKRGHFAWEYKGKRKNLSAAYGQLLQYREALENPPVLVTCDLERFEIHTNFTGTVKQLHKFDLSTLAAAPAEPLRLLRALMSEPHSLRPQQTREQITEEAARRFAELAQRLQDRGEAPEKVAHFLNRLLFCFFAEDVGLLPRGLLTRLLLSTIDNAYAFNAKLGELFRVMATRGNERFFGTDEIEWFNGGLFDSDHVLALDAWERGELISVARLDWSEVEPAILGTLFERGLDPAKRSQLGAHYTDLQAILRVVGPVVIAPLRREFDFMKAEVAELLAREKATTKHTKKATRSKQRFSLFLERLRAVRVLDPACGSGNFLYVALRLLKDLEKEVVVWGAQAFAGTAEFPMIGPHNVLGIELNAYASELARVSVWIGEIQWMLANGYAYHREPVLKPLDNIECRDAILVEKEGESPERAEWPKAEFIIGNPPFLGGKKLRTELGDEYVDALFKAWAGRVPAEADLVCYWHEKAREVIERKRSRRAGLLATNSIRGGANLLVLRRLKESGEIFMAWADEPWVVAGANVRVSIVGQDDGSETQRSLNGQSVEEIFADLSAGSQFAADVTTAVALRENTGLSFMGDTKGGPFDLDPATAEKMLAAPANPNGRRNQEVVVPWLNGLDVTRRARGMWIVDFGAEASETFAAGFELPFEHVRKEVKPARATNNREAYRDRWWLHVEPRPAMRAALDKIERFIATPTVAKHRIFVWLRKPTLPDHQLILIARADDYAFGVLHSRVHEVWALKLGTSLEDRPRYTPSSTFETFPFPWPLNTPENALTADQKAKAAHIAHAAAELNRQREAWLNPPEWTQPASGPSALRLARDEVTAVQLKKRTLTNLYNARPAWLDNMHRELDLAVLNAYGWPASATNSELIEQLLKLNELRR